MPCCQLLDQLAAVLQPCCQLLHQLAAMQQGPATIKAYEHILRVYVSMCVFVPVYASVCLCVCVFASQSVRLSVCLRVCVCERERERETVSERLVETNAQRDRDSKKHVSDSKQSNFMKNAQVSHFKFCYSNHRDKDSINRADFAQKDPRGLFLILIIFLQIRLSQQNSTHLTTLVAPIALIAVAHPPPPRHCILLFCFVLLHRHYASHFRKALQHLSGWQLADKFGRERLILLLPGFWWSG